MAAKAKGEEEEENHNANPDLYGQGDNNFDSRYAIVFNKSLGDSRLGSDNEPRAGMGHADEEMDVDDGPTNNASIVLFFICFAY
ncbi:hypothetical protein BDP27DRAFT_1427840 [Rhodocollybia butyracea]|uniref:Uncharacterized protein n=1 Tax=Rhodocollybia butyracea TaxID=206335 RepID=A0A9P5U1I7_9AGAR|nr:hypothetical protein BDP27DRAFT_1427840 [Rhodocollybia butyracea]